MGTQVSRVSVSRNPPPVVWLSFGQYFLQPIGYPLIVSYSPQWILYRVFHVELTDFEGKFHNLWIIADSIANVF